MTDSHLFNIAGHGVRIIFASTDVNSMALLPSLEPFRVSDDTLEPFRVSDETEKPLITLHVDDSLRPAANRKRLRAFDTGNGDTVVFLLPDGGYQFIIRDTQNQDCAMLISNADFSDCYCALNGNSVMRAFGLNNALMMSYAYASCRHQTLLIHASCVAYGGYGYPFLAKSGTGKSTHSSLWLRHIEDTELMNDDNPIIRVVDGTPYIYGTPWSGKTPCYRNIRRPLGALVAIERAPANSIDRQATVQAFATLLVSCSSMSWDSAINDAICNTVSAIISKTPVYTLHCLPDEAAARLCHATIAR